MDATISRRDFIKTTSATAAGATLMSVAPWASGMDKKRAKSLVVIAKDTTCVGNQTKIQDMMDHAIMTLTGQTEKVKAYEALFPAGKLTTSTKIMIKYNETSAMAMANGMGLTALKNGITSMLGGTFPAANITTVGKDNSAASTQSFKLGADPDAITYTLRNAIVNTDYFINYAPCWTMSSCGTRMALKNTITCFTGGSISSMHDFFTDSTYPAFAMLNSQPAFKDKLVLVLINAIDKASPNGSATLSGYSIIATKDIVAAEYQGLQLLKAISITGNTVSSTIQTTINTVLGFAADPKYGLGTNKPDEMEVINIAPPWNTAILTPGKTEINIKNIQVTTQALHTIFTHPGEIASVAIYSSLGRRIWTHRSSDKHIIWQNNDMNGNKVSTGIYLYQLKVEGVIARGEIAVK